MPVTRHDCSVPYPKTFEARDNVARVLEGAQATQLRDHGFRLDSERFDDAR